MFETSSVLLNLNFFFLCGRRSGGGEGVALLYMLITGTYIHIWGFQFDEKPRPLVWDRVLFM